MELLGLLPQEYYDLTPAELHYLLRGYQRRNLDHWRRDRLMTFFIVSAQGAKIKPSDLIDLPGDKEALKEVQKQDNAATAYALAAALGGTVTPLQPTE